MLLTQWPPFSLKSSGHFFGFWISCWNYKITESANAVLPSDKGEKYSYCVKGFKTVLITTIAITTVPFFQIFKHNKLKVEKEGAFFWLGDFHKFRTMTAIFLGLSLRHFLSCLYFFSIVSVPAIVMAWFIFFVPVLIHFNLSRKLFYLPISNTIKFLFLRIANLRTKTFVN